METLKTFTRSDNIDDIKDYFNNFKMPFVLKNYTNVNIDLDFIDNNYGNHNVTTLNENSDKKNLTVSNFIKEIKKR